MVYVIAYVAPTAGKSARTVTFAVDPSTFSTRTSFTSQRGPASRHSSMFKLLSVAACVRNTFHAPRSLLVVGPAGGQGTLPSRIETRLDTVCVCGTVPNQERPHEWGRGRQECLRHVISHRRL